MEKAQATYKHDFCARLQGSLPTNIKSGDYALIRKEYYNPERKIRHQLSPIADGPFLVVSVPPKHGCSGYEQTTRAPVSRPCCPGPTNITTEIVGSLYSCPYGHVSGIDAAPAHVRAAPAPRLVRPPNLVCHSAAWHYHRHRDSIPAALRGSSW